jgi:hypothetical protein
MHPFRKFVLSQEVEVLKTLSWEHQHDDYMEETIFRILVNGIQVLVDNIALQPLINSGTLQVPVNATVEVILEGYTNPAGLISVRVESGTGLNVFVTNASSTGETAEGIFVMPNSDTWCRGRNN